MPGKRDNFKLGVTVLIMFILFVAAALFVGGSDLFAPATSGITVRFVPGTKLPELSEGSLVVYFGQKVGQVTSATFVEDQAPGDPASEDVQFLEVHAQIRKGLDIREDCRIMATGPPLGGKGSLTILNRGRSTTSVRERDYVYGSVSGFQAVIDNLSRELDQSDPESLLASIKLQLDAGESSSLIFRIHDLLAQVHEAAVALRQQLDPEQDGVMLAKIHGALDRINAGLAEAEALLKDNHPRVDAAVASVQDAARRLDEDIVTVLAGELEVAGDAEPGTVLTKVHDALDCVRGSLYNINVATEHGKRVVVLNKERINDIVRNTSDASALLKTSIKDLGLNPWKVLFQPSTSERRELHIYNVAREFAEAAAHMDGAAARLKSLAESKLGYIESDDPDLLEIRSDLEATLQRFSAAEQALLRELNVP